MHERLKSFIEAHQLFSANEKVLLAISGGMDSVVLAHLFAQLDLDFALAHCNFQLRGEASEGDDQFVEHLSVQLKVPFYHTRFDTYAAMQQRAQSLQLTARELRYEWLEEVRDKEGFTYVATAHHLNDSIETALYNFTKGSGIRGLHGIPVKNDRIIRPLLFASRAEIEDYIGQQQLAYREDTSNAERKYSRNRIRLDVVPVLRSINPALEKTMRENFQRIRETEWLFTYAVDHFRKQWVRESVEGLSIELLPLRENPAAASLLHEWLKPFAFTSDQLENALAKTTQTGAVFYATHHRLLVDRDQLRIQQIPEAVPRTTFEILPDTKSLDLGTYTLEISTKEGRPDYFPDIKNVALLDADSLIYPLQIRHWQPGDSFQPLGMQGHQKLQDFFSNLKVSLFEKEKAWILLNGDQKIICILAYRLDERFKINGGTKRFLEIKMD